MRFTARLITIAIVTLAISYFVVDVSGALLPSLPSFMQRLGSAAYYLVWIVIGWILRLGWPELGVPWRVDSRTWSRRDWLVIIAAIGLGLAMYAPMVARIMANGATPPRLDFVGGAGMAGFVEEWLFRGLVWNAIDSNAEYPRLGLVANLIAGSLVFGLFHLSFEGHSGQAIANVAPHAAFGLVMGILRWRTGSIVPGAVVHTVGNFVARLAMP